MTNELVFEALSDIDDVYVLEAKALFDGKPKTKMWKKFAVAAACFAIVFAAALPFLSDILSPVLDTRHKSNVDTPPNDIAGIPIVDEMPKEHIEVSPDNIIAVNPAANNPILYYSYSYQYYYECPNESAKTAFQETFTEETGYNLNEFALSLSRVFPTNAEDVCLEQSNTYVFSCELDAENHEYADVCIVSKERNIDRYFDSLFFISSNDFNVASISEPIILSEINGVPVEIFLLNKKYPVAVGALKDNESNSYRLINKEFPVYIAYFENDKVYFKIEAFTGDVSKLELLISAILTTPEAE